MGISTNPQLTFGIDLDDFDLDDFEWLQSESDFEEWVRETEGLAEDDWTGLNEVLKTYPVRVLDTCHIEEIIPVLYINGFHFFSSRGSSEIIEPEKMVVPQEAIDVFKKWIADQGLPIGNTEPKWLLTVLWC